VKWRTHRDLLERAKTADTEYSNTTLLLDFQNIYLNLVSKLRLHLPVFHGSSHDMAKNSAWRNASTASSEMQDFRYESMQQIPVRSYVGTLFSTLVSLDLPMGTL
jgi:hypothetical protein